MKHANAGAYLWGVEGLVTIMKNASAGTYLWGDLRGYLVFMKIANAGAYLWGFEG